MGEAGGGELLDKFLRAKGRTCGFFNFLAFQSETGYGRTFDIQTFASSSPVAAAVAPSTVNTCIIMQFMQYLLDIAKMFVPFL